MAVSVFIDGGHGTTGLEIHERLSGRAGLDLIQIPQEQRRDVEARRHALNDADIVILCLPDDAARDAVALIDNDRTRVIDASSAHRTAPGWVYGFPEYQAGQYDAVLEAKRISNPGCYSTGFIGLVAPLIAAGLLKRDIAYFCNAVSGYSGGGKAMIAEFESGEAQTAWRTYALAMAHKHVPEMTQQCGLTHRPLFAPSVANVFRGMIVDVPIQISAMKSGSADELRAALITHYDGAKFVRVAKAEECSDLSLLRIEHCAGTDRMELFVFKDEEGGQIRLIAALDNLGKGASGACVQTLNLISGFDEAEGLTL